VYSSRPSARAFRSEVTSHIELNASSSWLPAGHMSADERKWIVIVLYNVRGKIADS